MAPKRHTSSATGSPGVHQSPTFSSPASSPRFSTPAKFGAQHSSPSSPPSHAPSPRFSTASPRAKPAPIDLVQTLQSLPRTYLARTPPRHLLLDLFLAQLVFLGVVQFAYCVLAGNYPFNAFLSAFAATVGQFVLTVSLRMQTSIENRGQFRKVSDERAFMDYILGSLILHFLCVNFVN
ncbi:MAG: oligosaccharyltransferase complex subunit epsilon [Phylliscum demangeonii]|nr:MAG: oligosaccharyltransferase complex subunit epsilon [Phylliscum demangeonii]